MRTSNSFPIDGHLSAYALVFFFFFICVQLKEYSLDSLASFICLICPRLYSFIYFLFSFILTISDSCEGVARFSSVDTFKINSTRACFFRILPHYIMGRCHEKTGFCLCENKAQISFAATAKLISAFVSLLG